MNSRALMVTVLIVAMGCAGCGEGLERSSSIGEPKRLIAQFDALGAKGKRRALQDSIARGRAYLLEHQNADGSFSTGRNAKGFNILRPLPGSHTSMQVAVTALSVSALIETSGRDDGVAAKAIDKACAFLLDRLPTTRRDHPMVLYNCWSGAYGLEALASLHRWYDGDAVKQKAIDTVIAQQISYMARYEAVNGGWSYLDLKNKTAKPSPHTTCFTTAAILQAFHDVKLLGHHIPARLVERGVKVILRQRNPDWTFVYSDGFSLKFSAVDPGSRMPSTLGRSVACALVLRLWSPRHAKPTIVPMLVDRLIRKNVWLSRARKTQRPHESFFHVAGYYYYFGHYYAARALPQLPAADRAKVASDLAALLVPKQEPDGSWWDYPLYDYHWFYGTGFCLRSLQRCLNELPAE
ncbi:MAG: hypothetical protein HN909_00170 [Phycisphaerales bacterium]|jgi:hypothetical protein|nr:hypothetical protein [Phycisphaerales bacterium]MBT7170166.1 hypothetical protein [Phycisphaerales bacterium]